MASDSAADWVSELVVMYSAIDVYIYIHVLFFFLCKNFF